jgi:hypothetical protein
VTKAAHIDVGVVYEHVESGQNFDDGLHRRRRIFVATQIDDHPAKKKTVQGLFTQTMNFVARLFQPSCRQPLSNETYF